MNDVLTIPLADLHPPDVTVNGWQACLAAAATAGGPLVVDISGVARLDRGFIGALALADQTLLRTGGGIRLAGADDDQRILMRLANLERMLPVIPGSIPHDLSCIIVCSDESVILRVQPQAMQNSRLAMPGAYAWMRRLDAGRVIVDMALLPHINSVLVAWTLQIGQASKPATLTLRNISRQMHTQLTQLRLHHLFLVETPG